MDEQRVRFTEFFLPLFFSRRDPPEFAKVNFNRKGGFVTKMEIIMIVRMIIDEIGNDAIVIRRNFFWFVGKSVT